MCGYVLGSQPSWGDSGWDERKDPSTVDELNGKVLLQHKEADALNGLRAYAPEILKALKGAHQDWLQSDGGSGLILKYVSTYVAKFSEELATEWLEDDASDYHIAKRILFDYHPQEPDMWLQLAAQLFPVFDTGGSLFPIVAPYPGMDEKPTYVQDYEACEWKGKKMSLLEYLRKVGKNNNRPARYIREAFKRERGIVEKRGGNASVVDEKELEAFARGYMCKGEKLIAADTVWRLNDRYYGQWLALHEPFEDMNEFIHEEDSRLVPDRYMYLAAALRRRPDYWREPGFSKLKNDMNKEAVNPSQQDTVCNMILANTALIDKYLTGAFTEEQQLAEEEQGRARTITGSLYCLSQEVERLKDNILMKIFNVSYNFIMEPIRWS